MIHLWKDIQQPRCTGETLCGLTGQSPYAMSNSTRRVTCDACKRIMNVIHAVSNLVPTGTMCGQAPVGPYATTPLAHRVTCVQCKRLLHTPVGYTEPPVEQIEPEPEQRLPRGGYF